MRLICLSLELQIVSMLHRVMMKGRAIAPFPLYLSLMPLLLVNQQVACLKKSALWPVCMLKNWQSHQRAMHNPIELHSECAADGQPWASLCENEAFQEVRALKVIWHIIHAAFSS